MAESTLNGVLRERASMQPNDIAYTFVDYELDWEGVEQTLTWGQLYRRVRNLAGELQSHAASGDRAVVLAPQSLDYIVAFLASLDAGVVCVPLSTPMVGNHDERVTAVLRDAAPSVVLTTSAIAETVAPYAIAQDGNPAPVVLEVDKLELDSRKPVRLRREAAPETAYLQYTSGSTRIPAGVMVSNRNLTANFEQMMASFYPDYNRVPPADTTVVTWLPLYHDMGMMAGIVAPILGGWRTVMMSPLAFLARPARWMQQLGSVTTGLTAGPNFAFDLASAKTTDDDMAGCDLGNVLSIISGAERVHHATVERFTKRFAAFNLQGKVIRPSYGLAEATLYVATREPGKPPVVAHFEPEKLAAGHAERCANGTALISYGTPQSPAVRIVDPENRTEVPAGMIGEIWAQGENIAAGYWNRPDETQETFGATIDGSPDGTWLRTGDLGFISDGELFIIGRVKDLLIVRGRNHYPDDIEATVSAISRGRVAAIAVNHDEEEKLVAVIEVKKRSDESPEALSERLTLMKREVISAISTTHGLNPADLALVAPGSLPITTSGKVRRAASAELYRRQGFARLDA
ncbi:acyl-CoA synthetase [Mycolicibacterium fortuitum]|uniref:AMP-binding protein n=1 Tax=Mycolicibacterium fortuitum TaxID=1766 RepID=UPI0007EA4EA2|nr:AMP-binding protein [Mycolicibacterium fortuitum]OBG47592.1 acyl-CoA synthetase [Mycolicibacterium fortuitum]